MIKNVIFVIFVFVALFAFNLKANADVYKFVDEDGVAHFTVEPTDKRFQLFMKDIKKEDRNVKSGKQKEAKNSKIELPYGRTKGEYCRAYAFAIEAVAQARDNLYEPSWSELVKKNPVLKEYGKKNIRAIAYAQAIYLNLSGKNASPIELKREAYDRCLFSSGSSCMHFGVGCPKK